jgi:hypothetical protein
MFNLKFPAFSNKTIIYLCILVIIVIALSIFIAHREVPITRPTDYYIDVIGNVTITNKTTSIHVTTRGKKDLLITGWAVDERSKLLAGNVEVNIDGKLFPTIYGLDRPDVAKAYNIKAYEFSGFNALIPITKIGKGEHILSLKVFTNNNKDHYPAGDIIKFDIK